MGNIPVIKLLSMSLVIEGETTRVASLMILGPKPSIVVAFDVSVLLVKDKTWPHVIGLLWKSIFSGILLSERRHNFSKLSDTSEISFKILAIDGHYSFNFAATFEFIICLSFITNSSGRFRMSLLYFYWWNVNVFKCIFSISDRFRKNSFIWLTVLMFSSFTNTS